MVVSFGVFTEARTVCESSTPQWGPLPQGVGGMPAGTKIGNVSRAQYEEIIAEDRTLVEIDTKI